MNGGNENYYGCEQMIQIFDKDGKVFVIWRVYGAKISILDKPA